MTAPNNSTIEVLDFYDDGHRYRVERAGDSIRHTHLKNTDKFNPQGLGAMVRVDLSGAREFVAVYLADGRMKGLFGKLELDLEDGSTRYEWSDAWRLVWKAAVIRDAQRIFKATYWMPVSGDEFARVDFLRHIYREVLQSSQSVAGFKKVWAGARP